ncbi:DUF1073 domain-containing protein [Jinshanibacter sp. LJY008]|uniref:DUF1073 domain-containing protein n=1 Tax=Limnobaculum eriocheiris TaxID=2897391 RepID=A0A9X1SK24_9GAMM|nr:DUF1073 domain-containing protein [Limnobaculum eriocheiris]MCD1124819.1 DUF1073 domain-containing protein [Limnobaculum eriocheiris]
MSIFDWFKKKPEPPQEQKKPDLSSGFFTTDIELDSHDQVALNEVISKSIQQPLPTTAKGVGMDSAGMSSYYEQCGVPDAQFAWYNSQGFIGYQTCAILLQHWLIDKACTMPGRDAIRNGYEIKVNGKVEVNPEIIAEMDDLDKKFKLNEHMLQLVRLGRGFGIRHALFIVDSDDPFYYTKPFNPDGVKPGSYKGISQIDPYWLAPVLNAKAVSKPEDPYFYEPTYWQVSGGKKIHRSHFVIMRTNEVPDILKPTYLYGGISVPQKIYERVYAAERTANEAPQLAMTKRSTVIHTDVSRALANQRDFEKRMSLWSYIRDNYGIKVLDKQETVEQFDTSLNDLDATIMTQYQLVAAAAHVPATKLIETTPKGFNATGEYEESSYHEELESIQEHDLSPLLDRHHLLCNLSIIKPKYGVEFDTYVSWKPVDSPTASELAEINLKKSQTDKYLSDVGGIDGDMVLNRVVNDPDSGYSGVKPIPTPEDTDGEEIPPEEVSGEV